MSDSVKGIQQEGNKYFISRPTKKGQQKLDVSKWLAADLKPLDASALSMAEVEYEMQNGQVVRIRLKDQEWQSIDKGERVVLKVWISDSGEVTAMETEFTDMPASVHEATVAAFRRMRFMPGEIDGKHVGSIMKIEMTYRDFRLPVE